MYCDVNRSMQRVSQIGTGLQVFVCTIVTYEMPWTQREDGGKLREESIE